MLYSPRGVERPSFVSVERSAGPGRPKKIIDMDVLRAAMRPGSKITQTRLSSSLGIDRKTLRARAKEAGLEERYTKISEEDLDDLVQEIRHEKPNIGQRYLEGALAVQDKRIPRKELRAAVHRVDGLGTLLRKQQHKKVKRCGYRTDRPNSMWHIDGHHKLIHWGIVIHGIVDGYSRKVRFFLKNTQSSRLTLFSGSWAQC